MFISGGSDWDDARQGQTQHRLDRTKSDLSVRGCFVSMATGSSWKTSGLLLLQRDVSGESTCSVTLLPPGAAVTKTGGLQKIIDRSDKNK